MKSACQHQSDFGFVRTTAAIAGDTAAL